jgi:hypothetical protein
MKVTCQGILQKTGMKCMYTAKHDNNTHCGYHKSDGYHCYSVRNKINVEKSNECNINNLKYEIKNEIKNEIKDMISEIRKDINRVKINIENNFKLLEINILEELNSMKEYIAAAIKPLAHLIMDNTTTLNSCNRNTRAISRSMSEPMVKNNINKRHRVVSDPSSPLRRTSIFDIFK